MGFATDLGYISPNVKAQLQDLDLLLLESNHDLEMLKDGPYPWSVKQRVLSRVGHLSNEAAAAFLEDGYDGQAAYVILAHLSESNNLPELARVAAERAVSHAARATFFYSFLSDVRYNGIRHGNHSVPGKLARETPGHSALEDAEQTGRCK
jgi:phosphoribosyl 1,2-cyclic phosphodiesterase